jgi:hypothetical protein
MKPNELRIGNLVKLSDNTTIFSVNYIEEKWVEGQNFKGIPLTEEWLLKFGFDDLGTYGYGRGNFHICLHYNEFYFPINNRKVFIQQVHQIQNLYWSLCGEELVLMHK